QYEVRAEETLGAPLLAAITGYDLLIIDGAALREDKQLTAELTRAIQDCKTPTLWLEDAGAAQAPKREKLMVLQKPIEKEPFHSAVDGFLSGETSPRTGTKPSQAPGPKAAATKREPKKKDAAQTEQGSFQFIDLVDAIEEKVQLKQGEKAAKKSK
ncbi:MAG: hypothetical protein ACREP8_14580, partial [Candidatus Binatia bacterium]